MANIGELQRLRDTMVGALHAIEGNDEQRVLERFGELASLPNGALRTAVSELAMANEQMLGQLCGARDDTLTCLELLDDDGDDVDIDTLEPALRAAVRMLLALRNGRPDDAMTQLDVVQAAGDPAELGVVLFYLLMWSEQFITLCQAVGKPTPDWLRPDATGH
ncbi:MAG: hypothetical protein J2O49_03310 [Sciscionella sp.]|nr:hypothetical protein [Sciscionella sp.]